jgi:DNA adenine methylase
MKKFKEKRQKLSLWMATSKIEALMKEYQTDSITDVFSKLVDDKLNNNFAAREVHVQSSLRLAVKISWRSESLS